MSGLYVCASADYDAIIRAAVGMSQCDLIVARRLASDVLRSWPRGDALKECKLLGYLAATAKWAVLDAEKDTLGSLSGYYSHSYRIALAASPCHALRYV
jgi:hypothetical protein